MTDGYSFLKQYAIRCCEAALLTDFQTLSDMADVILRARHAGKRILTAGNGGSAATASHICNDLQKGARVYERTGFSATCLGDSLPVLTCLANDFSYEDIYRIQIETQAEEGDVFLAFSGSGNSENVVRAAKAARDRGVLVLGFLGRDGGKLKPLCDIYVIAPTDCMEMIEDIHMLYCHALVSLLKQKLQEEWGAETVRPAKGRTFRAALFDFDGTVSLIRANWREVMLPYFTDVLETASPEAARAGLEKAAAAIVDGLTGKQTIFQCIELDKAVQSLGGAHTDPAAYKQGFLDRMEERVTTCRKGLVDGTLKQEDWLVPGIINLVETLERKGIRCYLASGTDEEHVLTEAKLLGVDRLFSGGIYGAKAEQEGGVKEELLERLIASGEIEGNTLVCFGDGPSELTAAKAVGGYAVGVALDETKRFATDMRKRDLLLSAGADMIIPDYSDTASLLKLLGI